MDEDIKNILINLEDDGLTVFIQRGYLDTGEKKLSKSILAGLSPTIISISGDTQSQKSTFLYDDVKPTIDHIENYLNLHGIKINIEYVKMNSTHKTNIKLGIPDSRLWKVIIKYWPKEKYKTFESFIMEEEMEIMIDCLSDIFDEHEIYKSKTIGNREELIWMKKPNAIEIRNLEKYNFGEILEDVEKLKSQIEAMTSKEIDISNLPPSDYDENLEIRYITDEDEEERDEYLGIIIISILT
jgi:hypothetical protein